MAKHYKTKITFESEDLLTEVDEYVPTYTAYLSAVEFFKDEDFEIELDRIEDEQGNEIPINKFDKKTISSIYDATFMANWDKIVEEYDYDDN